MNLDTSYSSRLPMVVNPQAVQAYNESRDHHDPDVRRMVKDEFLSIFMEIAEVGIAACEDFKTINMYHIAHSDAVHDFLRDYSSLEVLTSESAPRANRKGVSVVSSEGTDLMTKSVFYDKNKRLHFLDPDTYASGSQRPKWLPRFRRLHICDVISLNMQKDVTTDLSVVQSDTFLLELRHLDEQDEYFSLDGYEPMKRVKVMFAFPDKFWKIFYEIFPPYDISDNNSLGIVVRPSFSDDCRMLFDTNIVKGEKKVIAVSRNTKNIMDRMILGFDNIRHEMLGDNPPRPGMEDVVVRYDINLCYKNE